MPALLSSPAARSGILPGGTLLLLLTLTASRPLAAQTTVEIPVDIIVYSGVSPADPSNCGARLVAEFDDEPVATRYTLYYLDTGNRRTRSGPPFDDGPLLFGTNPAPSGRHRFSISGLTRDQGANSTCDPSDMVNYLEGLDGTRFQDWRLEVTIEDDPPTAAFTWDESPTTSFTIDFDASDSSDPDGRIVSYDWTFGDGGKGQGKRTSHTYAAVGTYTVKLTVMDDVGQKDTATERVDVEDNRLRYSLHVDPEEVSLGDTIRLQVEVKNTGPDPVHTLVINGVPRTESIDDGGVQQLTSPGVIAELAPGATDVFTYLFRAAAAGNVLFKLDGFDLGNTEIEIVGQTDTGEVVAVCNVLCNAGVVIKADEVTVTLKTDSGQGRALGVKSGLVYKPGFPVQMMEPIDPDGSLASINFVCRSACVDVEVEVLREEDGMPVENADVTLGAPVLSSPAIITPDNSGGYFCERAKSLTEIGACGNPLSLTTDEEGKINAYYVLPGVIEDVPVTITATVQRWSSLLTETADLTIQPNLIIAGTHTIGHDEAVALLGDQAAIVLGAATLGEVCKAAVKGVLDPKLGRVKNAALNTVTATFVDYLCSLAPESPLAPAQGLAKRGAEIMQWYWFFSRFDVDLPGYVDIRPAPPIQFVDFENDFLAAINAAMEAAVGVIKAGSTFDVKLYEMSYLQRDALINPFTPALYFTMEVTPPDGPNVAYKKLMEGGTYDPTQWLLPPLEQFYEDILTEGAGAGSTQLNTSGAGAFGSKHTGTDSQRFEPGDYIGINLDAETEEFNQIMAVENNVLFLAAPLQHDHAADESVARLAAGAPASPASPLLVPLSGDVEPVPPPALEWVPTPLSFPMSYDLQLASDTTFMETLVDTTGLTTTAFAPEGIIWAGSSYVWRVRAVNLVGEGAWSRPSVFRTRATGVAVEEDEKQVPERFTLAQNYPNPFNPQTTIPFELPRSGPIRLAVYDVLGREVAVLVQGVLPAGRHEAVFDAACLSSGVYVYRLEAAGRTHTRTMLLLK